MKLGVDAGKERRQNYLKAIFREVRDTANNVNVIMGVGGYVVNKEVSVFFFTSIAFFFN
jgi:hypothetical protein